MSTDEAKRIPFVSTSLAAPGMERAVRSDGVAILASHIELGEYPVHQGEILQAWSERSPDDVLLAERGPNGEWHSLTYAAAADLSARVGEALLVRGQVPERPIAMLCDATVNMGILKLAAMQVGIPSVPVSPAYSLMTQDYAKLRYVFDITQPGLVYCSNSGSFAQALAAVDLNGATIVSDESVPALAGAISFDELTGVETGERFRKARARVTGDTVAKILFTSGSTSMPKGVVNTQRMLCSNGKAVDLLWPFLAKRPPVIVDWLPWSHTFGTNFNFSQILRHGGTMYIDSGRPMPGRIETTVQNLMALRPTLLYKVPRGFDMLLPFVEADDGFAEHLFGEPDAIFYAGAALPQHVWDRLQELSVRVRGRRVPILSALGSTETAPVATLSHWASSSMDGYRRTSSCRAAPGSRPATCDCRQFLPALRSSRTRLSPGTIATRWAFWFSQMSRAAAHFWDAVTMTNQSKRLSAAQKFESDWPPACPLTTQRTRPVALGLPEFS